VRAAGPSLLGPLRVPAFRRLWAAQLQSVLGDQVLRVALAVVVLERTGSAAASALTYAVTFLPQLLAGPALAGLADRFPRRNVMVAADLLRAALVAVAALPALPVPALLALVVVVTAAGSPFEAARSAVLPDVLPGGAYQAGAALTNVTVQGGSLAGFLLGGGLLALTGPSAAIALDAGSFVASAAVVVVALRGVPSATNRPRSSAGAGPGRWATVSAGARVVFGDPHLRFYVLLAWVAGAAAVVPEGLAAPLARQLGGGALVTGVLLAAPAAGMAAGGLMVTAWVPPALRVRVLSPLALAAVVPLLAVPIAATLPPSPAVVATAALLIASGVGLAFNLPANALFVERLDPALRGRAFGVAAAGIVGGQGLAIAAAGGGTALAGPAAVVAVAGLAGLAAVVLLVRCRPQAQPSPTAVVVPAPRDAHAPDRPRVLDLTEEQGRRPAHASAGPASG